MMKSLGFAFDEVSRERMTQRIASRVSILQGATPATAAIGADRVVWVDTLHPVSHPLDVSWSVDGTVVPGTGDARSIDLRALRLAPGTHTLTATVTDPTPFVRDPAVRASAALTQRRTWTVDTAIVTPPTTTPVAITGSTATDRPVGADDVVYVDTTHPLGEIPAVRWTLDGQPVDAAGNDLDLDLGRFRLTQGTHRLTAQAGGDSRTWIVDANRPQVGYDLSTALLTVPKPGRPTEYLFNGPFTMKLAGTDDTASQVTPEFRLDGDGWHNYYGWPTDAEAPFLFTATGTNVDDLVYGNPGPGGLSLSPFADRPPGYGRHTVEYRGIDAAGNIGAAKAFVATLIPPPPACTRTITGRHNGRLVVSSGVTCLRDATVSGGVTVQPGAALVAERSTISGALTSTGAVAVELLRSTVRGTVSVTGTTGHVTAVGSRVDGAFVANRNGTGTTATILAGNDVASLSCTGNTPAPVHLQAPNTVRGAATGQCRDL
jgi:hypothetical protein